MISKGNPIHRMREIQEERGRLLLQLAPFYAALDLVNSKREDGESADVCVSNLEHIPAFREPWQKMRTLQDEYDLLCMSVACAWEECPIRLHER